MVDEGGTLVVDLPKLYAEDADVPEDELTFTITEPPKNGRFLRLVCFRQCYEISSDVAYNLINYTLQIAGRYLL